MPSLLFYLIGYGRVVNPPQVDRLPAFCSATPTRSMRQVSCLYRTPRNISTGDGW